MSSDRIVTSRHVLRAVIEHDRRGSTRLLRELEALEPDLAEFVIETLTRLFYLIADAGVPSREARRSYRLAQRMVLVTVTALRSGYRDLWQPGEPVAPDGPVPPAPAAPPPPP